MNDAISSARVVCRTPSPSKLPVRIPKWKFDRLRSLLLQHIPDIPPGLAFTELAAAIRPCLTDLELETLGSLNWHLTTVKLELEVRGELQRLQVAGRQHLVRRVKR